MTCEVDSPSCSSTQASDRAEYENDLMACEERLKKVIVERDHFKSLFEDMQGLRSGKPHSSQSQHRILTTPEVVVLGSGSDEDIQLKSDEDGVIVTGRRPSAPQSPYHTISLEATASDLPDHAPTDLFIVHQVASLLSPAGSCPIS